jgi:hypothetical protein
MLVNSKSLIVNSHEVLLFEREHNVSTAQQFNFYLLFTIYDSLDPVHRVEKILALRVDADAEFFTFASQSFFQFGSALARE